MEIRRKIGSIEEVEQMVCELKDRLWREVWRDEIDLPGMKVEVEEAEGGGYDAVVSIPKVPGQDCAVPTEDGVK